MYIKKLELVNFQVIKEFSAEFNGNVYLITGDNELGKSTLLKAIGCLLTGERDAVLRNGEEKGFAKMVVGDDGEEYEVALNYTENNPRGTLTIKKQSTGEKSNNLSMLQGLFGYQDFDAVEFSRWSETAEGRRKQIAVVKSLLPPEIVKKIEGIDTEVAALREKRLELGREVKTLAGFADTLGRQLTEADLQKYAEPADIGALLARQEVMVKLEEKAKSVRDSLALRTSQLEGIPLRLDAEHERHKTAMREIDDAESAAREAYQKAVEAAEAARKAEHERTIQTIEKINADKADFETRKANCEKWLSAYETDKGKDTDVATFIEQAEAHNKKYNLVLQFKEKSSQWNKATSDYDKATADIEAALAERKRLVTDAEFPVEGLTFTEDGLELNGIPFVPGKVSDSQTMEVATKLIIACNPKVKVFRIARGESLGEARLRSIVELARKNGYQGFIENVVRGQKEMQIEEYTEA